MQKLKHNRYLKQVYQLVSRSLYFPPLVVLVAILIITIWPWQNARRSLQSNSNQAVEERVTRLQEQLKARFTDYSSGLQNAVALLRANPNLTREQWQAYFASLERNIDRKGIQGTGYIKIVSDAEVESLTQSMRSQGLPDFTVHPYFPGELNSAILYLYPETTNNTSAFGFNPLSEPLRKEAIMRARDSGKPALSNKVTLVQDKKIDDGQGFLLYVPYYAAGTSTQTPQERQKNLIGFVYGGFRASSFFKDVLETPSQQERYGVKVYDEEIKSQKLLYKTDNIEQLSEQDDTAKVIRPLSMLGITWYLEFTLDKNYLVSKSEKNAPTYILLVGVVTAFLVFLALLTIFKSRAAELQQQKDKEVNIAKDELLSLASHQMRTPATGVKQYLGMVLQGFAGKLSSSQQSLLNKAYKSNERQLYVINQILHLAKLESGRIVLAKHSTHINELITDIADEQHDEIIAHGHKLKLQIPKKKAVLNVDSHMIRMAVENLLSNAVKYTIEPGEIKIKLTQTTNHVKIAIKDSGVGIEQKEFSEIFKQFTRLYDDQTERVSGTGVGLYLADQLVKLHKGTLTVSSTVGQGSEFVISLPKPRNKKQ